MSVSPLYYPPANRTTQRFDDDWPGTRYPKVEKVVWHSTEGTGWTSYDGGAKAPHMTVRPDMAARKVHWRAHFPADMNSRALRNSAGGVQTNLDGAFQIEIIGTCDPVLHRKIPSILYTPEAPGWFLDEMAKFVAWAHTHWKVPLKSPTFQAYPASAGARKPDGPSNKVRLSGAAWNAYRGHVGHQHVPENSHGDPGSFPMPAILNRATELEDDMSAADVRAIKAAIPTPEDMLAAKVKLTAAAARQMKLNEGDEVSVSYLLQWGGAGLQGFVASQSAQLAALTTAVQQLAAGVGIDAAEIQVAAEAGAAAALAEFERTVANVP